MRSTRFPLARMALCVVTFFPIYGLAEQGTDCRRVEDPAQARDLDLTGDWTDNSVNLKVEITQTGNSPLHQLP